MEDNDKDIHEENQKMVELRSSNTRRFIAEEPPMLVRMGTTLISLILLCTMLIACFVRVGGNTLFALFNK